MKHRVIEYCGPATREQIKRITESNHARWFERWNPNGWFDAYIIYNPSLDYQI